MALVPNNPNVNHIEAKLISDLDLGTSPLGTAAGTPVGQPYGETAYVATGLGTGRAFIVGRRNVADDQHVWIELATAAAVLIPDQRFTVGSAAYNLLNPGLATFLTIATAIVAAQAGVIDGTTLGAASSTSRRLVEIQPLVYSEALTGASAPQTFVNLRGMGVAREDTKISQVAGTVIGYTNATPNGVLEIENLTLEGTINLTFTANGRVTFRKCKFADTVGTPTPINITSTGLGIVAEVVFEDCDGVVDSISASGTGGVLMTIFGQETDLTLRNAVNGISLACQDLNRLYIRKFASVTNGRVGGGPIATVGIGTEINDVFLDDESTLTTGNTTSPPIAFNSTPGSTNNLWIDDIHLSTVPPSLFTTSVGTTVTLLVSEYRIVDTSSVLGSTPLPATGVASASAWRRNEPANRAEYPLNLAAIPGGGGSLTPFYATNAPNGAAQTFDAFADTHRVTVDYGDITAPGYALDPNIANLGATFRYALFQLPDANRFENGRQFRIKNGGDPGSLPTAYQGPFAVALTAGSAGTIDFLPADPATIGPITSAQYPILAAGQSILLEADRANNRWLIVG